MATNLLTCCERLDESKYWHKCACPSATPVCESEQVNATLCGYSEYKDPSVPPKKYTVATTLFFGTASNYSASCPSKIARSDTYSGSCVNQYDTSTCVTTTISDTSSNHLTAYQYYSDCELAYQNDFDVELNCNQIGQVAVSPTQKSYSFPGDVGSINKQTDLTLEDTEADAISRATTISGTSCSSLWETRSTGFSWTKRTSGYTIECDNLVVGLEYEVTPSIRKRTAVIGSYGAWEDVTVTPTTFTATSKTETIDDSGNPIDLDHIQGYEYQITGVTIEKTA